MEQTLWTHLTTARSDEKTYSSYVMNALKNFSPRGFYINLFGTLLNLLFCCLYVTLNIIEYPHTSWYDVYILHLVWQIRQVDGIRCTVSLSTMLANALRCIVHPDVRRCFVFGVWRSAKYSSRACSPLYLAICVGMCVCACVCVLRHMNARALWQPARRMTERHRQTDITVRVRIRMQGVV